MNNSTAPFPNVWDQTQFPPLLADELRFVEMLESAHERGISAEMCDVNQSFRDKYVSIYEKRLVDYENNAATLRKVLTYDAYKEEADYKHLLETFHNVGKTSTLGEYASILRQLNVLDRFLWKKSLEAVDAASIEQIGALKRCFDDDDSNRKK